jgi:hypothetical protein
MEDQVAKAKARKKPVKDAVIRISREDPGIHAGDETSLTNS